MNWDDVLFVLSGPLMVMLAALVTAWIADRQDAREDRRRARKVAAGE